MTFASAPSSSTTPTATSSTAPRLVAPDVGVLEVRRPDPDHHRGRAWPRSRPAARGSRWPPNDDLVAVDRGLEQVHRRRADERGDEQVGRVLVQVRAACRAAARRRPSSRPPGRPASSPRPGRASRRRWSCRAGRAAGRARRASARAAWRRGWRAARPSGTPAARARSPGPSPPAGAGRPRAPRLAVEQRLEAEHARRLAHLLPISAFGRLRSLRPKAMFCATVMCG